MTLETTIVSHFAKFGQVAKMNSLRRHAPMHFVPQATLDGQNEVPTMLKVSILRRDSRSPMLLIEAASWRTSAAVQPADVAKVVARYTTIPQMGRMNVRCVAFGDKTEIRATIDHIIPARGLVGESLQAVIDGLVSTHQRMISGLSKLFRDQQ